MSTVHTTVRSTASRHRAALPIIVFVATALVTMSVLWTAPAEAGVRPDASASSVAGLPDPGATEAEFVARINQLRASRGLGALSVDPELTAQARQWASTMTGAGRIYHAGDLSSGISADWQKLGENVGVGGDVGSLFQAFVDSPSHYANLVDPAYTRIGVGVVNAGDRMYTAHRFMAVAPPPPPPPPPTAPPTTAPPPPSTVAPTTAPPTTAAPSTTTTTAAPEPDKLGPVHRIADLVAPSDAG